MPWVWVTVIAANQRMGITNGAKCCWFDARLCVKRVEPVGGERLILTFIYCSHKWLPQSASALCGLLPESNDCSPLRPGRVVVCIIGIRSPSSGLFTEQPGLRVRFSFLFLARPLTTLLICDTSQSGAELRWRNLTDSATPLFAPVRCAQLRTPLKPTSPTGC